MGSRPKAQILHKVIIIVHNLSAMLDLCTYHFGFLVQLQCMKTWPNNNPGNFKPKVFQ